VSEGEHGLNAHGGHGFAKHGFERYREELLGHDNPLLTDEAVERFRKLVGRRGEALSAPREAGGASRPGDGAER
jgi:hypothetical protein